LVTLTLACVVWPFASVAGAETQWLEFTGACDGSAAVLLGEASLWVASDRDNVLRRYDARVGGEILGRVDVYPALEIERGSTRHSAHLEGAALLGRRSYWIGSHGRNRLGQNRPNRRRLVALDATLREGAPSFERRGRATRDLLERLDSDRRYTRLGLANWIRLPYKRLEVLAPERRGFSIGGLARSRNGSGLLIALRGPVIAAQAVLVPLLNPVDALEQGGEIRLGDPVRLPLDGLGVRSLEYAPKRDRYLIAAGSPDELGPFRLYEWSGRVGDRPRALPAEWPADFRPEAMVIARDEHRVLLLGDDGERIVEGVEGEACRPGPGGPGCPCDLVTVEARKRFRGLWISWPQTSAQAFGEGALVSRESGLAGKASSWERKRPRQASSALDSPTNSMP